MAMTCPRCGAAVELGARFCGQCGAPTESGAVRTDGSGPPTFPTPKVTHVRPTPVRRRGTTFAGGARMVAAPLAIVALGLVLLVAALLLLRRMPTPVPAGATRATPTPAPTIPVAQPARPAGPAEVTLPFAGSLRPRPTASAAPAVDVGLTALPTPRPTAEPTPRPTPTPEVAASYRCRGLADFDVSPEEAVVTVDGRRIGIADDWDDAGGGELYELPGPGPHWVQLTLAGYAPAWVVIVVDDDAEEEVAQVDLELRRLQDDDADEADRDDDDAEEEPGRLPSPLP